MCNQTFSHLGKNHNIITVIIIAILVVLIVVLSITASLQQITWGSWFFIEEGKSDYQCKIIMNFASN